MSMYDAVEKIISKAVSQTQNTKPELGSIISISPFRAKLDLDDESDFLESSEIMIPKHIIFQPQDIGKRCVVMLTQNGKYVFLGVV